MGQVVIGVASVPGLSVKDSLFPNKVHQVLLRVPAEPINLQHRSGRLYIVVCSNVRGNGMECAPAPLFSLGAIGYNCRRGNG